MKTVELVLNPVIKSRGIHVEELSSNSSTGFEWQWVDRNCPGCVEETHEYLQAKTAQCGVGGIEKWTFRSKMVGEEVVKLEYTNGQGDVSDTFEIRFIVRQR
ncbi:MAG: protease inhibitor I42 family protein [Thermoguttaceae bacterium]